MLQLYLNMIKLYELCLCGCVCVRQKQTQRDDSICLWPLAFKLLTVSKRRTYIIRFRESETEQILIETKLICVEERVLNSLYSHSTEKYAQAWLIYNFENLILF